MQTTVICPQCRSENTSENQYCISCGTFLGAVAPTSEPAPQNPYTQPVAYPPPYAQPSAPYGSGPIAQPFYGALRIDKLGPRLDGWADLVEGGADKCGEIQDAFLANIRQRQMPDIQITQATLTPGGLAGKQRNYQLSQSYTGATVAIYFGTFGQDLYVAWELFVRPVIKWRNLAIMGGVAAFLALCPAWIGNDMLRSSFFGFFAWVMATLLWLIPVAIGAAVFGRVMGGSFLAFFMEEIDLFAADDVTAMIIAIHKSILASIDAVGLKASLLHPKEHFTAGRRERVI